MALEPGRLPHGFVQPAILPGRSPKRVFMETLQSDPCYIHPIPASFSDAPIGTFVIRRASNYNEENNKFYYTLEYRNAKNEKSAVKFEVTDAGYSFVTTEDNKQHYATNVAQLIGNLMIAANAKFTIPLKTFLDITSLSNRDQTAVTNDLKRQLSRLGNPAGVIGYAVCLNPKDPLSATLIMVTTLKVDDSSRTVEVKENYSFDLSRGGFVLGSKPGVYANVGEILAARELPSSCSLENLRKTLDLAEMQKLLPLRKVPIADLFQQPPQALQGRVNLENPNSLPPLPAGVLPPGLEQEKRPIIDRSVLKDLGFHYTDRGIRQSTYQAVPSGTLLVWESLSQKGKLVVLQKLPGVAFEDARLQLVKIDETLMDRLKNFDINAPSLETPTMESEARKKAQLAMEKANGMANVQKVQILDWLLQKVTQNINNYDAVDFNNILKTLQAAKHLVANAEMWEAYAVKIQSGEVSAEKISKKIYDDLHLIAHPDVNDEAPLLRSFGQTMVSGCLAAIEMGQLEGFLKNAVSGDDICLEARERSASSWMQNIVLSSVPIDVDPNRDDHYKAVGNCMAAFKERRLRAFYNQYFKKDYEGGDRAGYGEKMLFESDTWKAFKTQLELDPRFYNQYFNEKAFVEFFKNEFPEGLNLEKEEGEFTNINAGNILKAVANLKNVINTNPFIIDDRKEQLMDLSEKLIKNISSVTGPNNSFKVKQVNDKQFIMTRPDRPNVTFEVLPGAGIKTDKPGTGGILQLYFPSIEDFFKSLHLKWPD